MMKTLMKYLGVFGLGVLCLSVATVTHAAITQVGTGTGTGTGTANMVNPCRSNGGYYVGCDPSRYPGSTEFCYRWIPEHLVPVTVMVPGRWEYRRVWIPGYPATQYQRVPGFWQITGSNVRPDVYVWGTPNGGWYATPYQNQREGYQQYGGYQPGGYSGGYFDAYGVWHPYQ
jgi:hypothetical protein